MIKIYLHKKYCTKRNIFNISFLKLIFIFCFTSLLFNNSFSQHNFNKEIKLKKVSCPEKFWAIKHPLVFKKAVRITKHVLNVTDSIKHLSILDGDAEGGQVDAFRHSYWLALLTLNIGQRRAYSLGKAHEKGNYRDFKKKKRKGIVSLQDYTASEMDYFNNKVGIEIGKKFNDADYQYIQNVVIDSIVQGKMMVIFKNKNNKPLDCSESIIPDEQIKFNWLSPKCIVPSNTPRK